MVDFGTKRYQTGVTKKYAYKTYQYKLNLTTVVKDTKYPVMDETGGCKLVSLVIDHVNDETDSKAIDILITKDGIEYLYDSSEINILSVNDDYALYISTAKLGDVVFPLDLVNVSALACNSPMVLGSEDAQHVDGKPLCGHAIKVELIMTDTVGTNQTLRSKCTYEVSEEVT